MNKRPLLTFLVLLLAFTPFNTHEPILRQLTSTYVVNDSFTFSKTKFAASHIEFTVDISYQRNDNNLPLISGNVYDVGLYSDADNFYYHSVTITKDSFVHVRLDNSNIPSSERSFKFAIKQHDVDSIFVYEKTNFSVTQDDVDVIDVSRYNVVYDSSSSDNTHTVKLTFNDEVVQQEIELTAVVVNGNGDVVATATKQSGYKSVDMVFSNINGNVEVHANGVAVTTIHFVPVDNMFTFETFTQCIYIHANNNDVEYKATMLNDMNVFALTAYIKDNEGAIKQLPMNRESNNVTFYITDELKAGGQFTFMIIDNNDFTNPLYTNNIWMSNPMIHEYYQFYDVNSGYTKLNIEGLECPFEHTPEEEKATLKEVKQIKRDPVSCTGEGCEYSLSTNQYGEFLVTVKNQTVGLVNLNKKFSEADLNFEFPLCYAFSDSGVDNVIELHSSNYGLEYISQIVIKDTNSGIEYTLTTSNTGNGFYFTRSVEYKYCNTCSRNNILYIHVKMKTNDAYQIMSIKETINEEELNLEDKQYTFFAEPIVYSVRDFDIVDYKTSSTWLDATFTFDNEEHAERLYNALYTDYTIHYHPSCNYNDNQVTCSYYTRSFFPSEIEFHIRCSSHVDYHERKTIDIYSYTESDISVCVSGTKEIEFSFTVNTPNDVNENLYMHLVNVNSEIPAMSGADGYFIDQLPTILTPNTKFRYEFNQNMFATLTEGIYYAEISKNNNSEHASLNYRIPFYRYKNITAVTPIYGGIKSQTAIFTFTHPVISSSISEIILEREDLPAVSVEIGECYKYEEDNTVKCYDANLLGTSNGTYTLSIRNGCGEEHDAFFSLDVLVNHITGFETNIIQHKTTSQSVLKVNYEAPFNYEDNIVLILYNVDTGEEDKLMTIKNIPVNEGYKKAFYVNGLSTQHEIIFEENYFIAGYYNIITKFKNEVEDIYTQGFHIYKDQLTLLHDKMLLSKGTSLDSFKIDFINEDLYQSRIQSIYLNDNQQIETYTVNSTTKTIILQDDIKLDTNGVYTITIKSALPEPDIVYTIVIVSQLTFENQIVFYTNPIETKHFTVTLDSVIDDISLISKITTNVEDVQFIIDSFTIDEPAQTTQMLIRFINTDIEALIGKYTEINIFNVNDDNILTQHVDYFVLTSTNAPIRVYNTTIEVSSDDDEGFTIAFDDTALIDEVFLEEFQVTLTSGEDVCDVNLISIDEPQRQLRAHSVCLESNTVFTFKLTFMGTDVTSIDGLVKEITVDFYYSQCNVPYKLDKATRKCKLCRDVDPNKPFYSKGNCLAACDRTDVAYDNICYNSCADVVGHNYEYEKFCYESCDEAYSLNQRTIPQGYLNLNRTINKCEVECEFGFGYEKICYPRDLTQLEDEERDTCILISKDNNNEIHLVTFIKQEYADIGAPRIVKGRLASLNTKNIHYIGLTVNYDETTMKYTFNEEDSTKLVTGEYQIQFCLVDDCSKYYEPTNMNTFHITKPIIAIDHFYYKENPSDITYTNFIFVEDMLCNPGEFKIINDQISEVDMTCEEIFPKMNKYNCYYTLEEPVVYGEYMFKNKLPGKEKDIFSFILNRHISEIEFEIVRPFCISYGLNPIEMILKDEYKGTFDLNYITSIKAGTLEAGQNTIITKEDRFIDIDNSRNIFVTEETKLTLYLDLYTSYYNGDMTIYYILADEKEENKHEFTEDNHFYVENIISKISPKELFVPRLASQKEEQMKFTITFDKDISAYSDDVSQLLSFENDFVNNCAVTGEKEIQCLFNENIDQMEPYLHHIAVKCHPLDNYDNYHIHSEAEFDLMKYEVPDDFPLCQTKDKTAQDMAVTVYTFNGKKLALTVKKDGVELGDKQEAFTSYIQLVQSVENLEPGLYSYYLSTDYGAFPLFTEETNNPITLLPLIMDGKVEEDTTILAGSLNQRIVVTLNEEFTGELEPFTLVKDTFVSDPIECTLQDSKTIICENVDTSSLDKGSYFLQYTNKCDLTIKTKIKVTLIENELKLSDLETIDITKQQPIVITHKKEFAATGDLVNYIFTNYDDGSTYTFVITTITEDKVTVVPQENTEVPEGKYWVTPNYIKVPTLGSGVKTKFFILIMQELELETDYIAVILSQSKSSHTFEFTFKNKLYEKRIKKIDGKDFTSELTYSNGNSVVYHSIEVSGKGGIKTIVITDISDNTVECTLNIMKQPNTITHEKLFYMDEINPSLKITFDTAITDTSVFHEIYYLYSNTKHYFNITAVPDDNTNTKFMLSLFDTETFPYGKIKSIYFRGKNNQNILRSLTEVVIMRQENLPTALVKTEYIAIKGKIATIIFNDPLYETYKEKFTISQILADGQELSNTCTINKLYEETDRLEIKCEEAFKTYGTYQYKIKLFDKEYDIISITVQDSYCKAPTVGNSPDDCKLCSQRNPQEPIYYHGECITTCKGVVYNTVCYDSPKDYISLDIETFKSCNLLVEGSSNEISITGIQGKRAQSELFPKEFYLRLLGKNGEKIESTVTKKVEGENTVYTFKFNEADFVEGEFEYQYYYIDDSGNEVEIGKIDLQKVSFTSITLTKQSITLVRSGENDLHFTNMKCDLEKATLVNVNHPSYEIDITCSDSNKCSIIDPDEHKNEFYGDFEIVHNSHKLSEKIKITKPISTTTFEFVDFPVCGDYNEVTPIINTFRMKVADADADVFDITGINQILVDSIYVTKSQSNDECSSNCFYIDSNNIINAKVAFDKEQIYQIKKIIGTNTNDAHSFEKLQLISTKSIIDTVSPDYYIIDESTTLVSTSIDIEFIEGISVTDIIDHKLILINGNEVSCTKEDDSKIECSLEYQVPSPTNTINVLDIGVKCSDTTVQKKKSFSLVTYKINYHTSKCMTKGINTGNIELEFNKFKSETTLITKVVKENSNDQELPFDSKISESLEGGKYKIIVTDKNDNEKELDSFTIQNNIDISEYNKLYADSPNQEIKISLATVYESTITEFIVHNNDHAIKTQQTTCTNSDMSVTCSGIDFSNIPPGDYSISFKDSCENIVTPSKKLTLIHNEIKKITNDKLNVGTTPGNVEITFEALLSQSIMVKLVDIDDTTHIITINTNDITINGKTISFNIPNEISYQGKYIIIIYNSNNNSIITQSDDKTFIHLITHEPSIDTPTEEKSLGSSSKDMVINLSNIPNFYNEFIKDITFNSPDQSQEGTSVEFEYENGLITITSDVELTVGGVWTIVLTDIFDKEFTVEFTVLNQINKINHKGVFVFDSSSKSYDVEFDVAITNVTIFTLITTKINGQAQFTIAPKENDTTNKVFTLTLINANLFTTIQPQLPLYFYGDNDNLIASTTITVVPSSKAPYKFKATSESIRRYTKEISFEFLEKVYPEYTSQITVKNDISSCNLNRIATNKLYFMCDIFDTTGTYNYGYYFNGKKLNEFTITITEYICKEPKHVYDPLTEQCKTCSDINSSKSYFYNYKCYAECPDNTVIYNNECYASCLVLDPSKLLYQQGKQCVETCTQGFKHEYKCVEECDPDLYTDYKNVECVNACPQGLYIYKKGCYESCEKAGQKAGASLIPNGYVCEKECIKGKFSYQGECYSSCNEVGPNLYGEGKFCKEFSNCVAYVEEKNMCYGNCTQSEGHPYSLAGAKSPMKCYAECPSGTALHEHICYSSCKQFGLVKEGGQCLERCLDNRVAYNGVCYDSCKNAPAANLFKDLNANCVSRCPEGSYGLKNECTEECPAYIDKERALCVDQCPSKISYKKICRSNCVIDGETLFYNEKTRTCEDKCSSGTHRLGDTCVVTCPFKLDAKQNLCVPKCRASQFTEGKNGDICYDKCPAGLKAKDDVCLTDNECANMGYVINDDECVKVCPIDKFKQGNKCVKSCGANEVEFEGECYDNCKTAKKAKKHEKLFLSEDNKKCVKKCPYSYDGESEKCVKCNLKTHFMENDECVKIKPDKGNCGRCHEHGSHQCNEKRSDNNNKECECNKGYTGISCGYYVGEGEGEDEEVQKERIHDVLGSVDFADDSEGTLYRIEDCTQVIKDLGTQPQMGDIANDNKTKEKCEEIVESSIKKIKQGKEKLNDNDNGNDHHHTELEIGGLAVTAELVALTGGNNGNGNGNGNGNNGNNGNGNGKGNKRNLLRNIQEADGVKTIIDVLADYYFTYYIKKNMQLESEEQHPSVEIVDKVISIQMWTDKTKLSVIEKDASFYNITYTNISQCIDKATKKRYTNIIFSKIDLHSELTQITNSEFGGVNSNVFYIKVAGVKADKTFDLLELTGCESFTSYIPLNISSYNVNGYNLSKSIGIEPYDTDTTIDFCTINDLFKYDLPQGDINDIARLNQKIYSVDILGTPINECKYKSIDVETNKAELVCTMSPTMNNFGLQISANVEQELQNAFKCIHKIRNIGTNIGFIVFAILIVALLIAEIICGIINGKEKDLDNSDIIALSNDKLVIQRFSLEEMEAQDLEVPELPETVYVKPKSQPKMRDFEIIAVNLNKQRRIWKSEGEPLMISKQNIENVEEFEIEHPLAFEFITHIKKGDSNDECLTNKNLLSDNQSGDEQHKLKEEKVKEERIPLPKHEFKTIILENIAELHPISALFRFSIIIPFFLRIAYFIFHLMSLLVFTAIILMLNDSNLKARSKNDNRNSFMYPLTNEMVVVIPTILCAMVMTALIKLIAVVTFNRKYELYDMLNSNSELVATKKEAIHSFVDEHKCRRIIGIIVIFIVGAGMCFISLVLCNYYVNSQSGLGFCFVWEILFEYILVAPLAIVIVSFVENSNQESKCVYYPKKLFMF